MERLKQEGISLQLNRSLKMLVKMGGGSWLAHTFRQKGDTSSGPGAFPGLLFSISVGEVPPMGWGMGENAGFSNLQ